MVPRLTVAQADRYRIELALDRWPIRTLCVAEIGAMV
jgi:hypothetical protein